MFLVSLSALACNGNILTDAGRFGSAPGTSFETPTGSDEPAYSTLHLRRLTQNEYARSVALLVGQNHPETGTLIPRDPRTPFDNDASDQIPSEALITGTELLATETTAALMKDTARRNFVVGCTPSGNDDGKCMRTFIRKFGRRAIRRTVSEPDVERYATAALLTAAEQKDFYAGVSVVVRAFLQHPRFLYRIETGTAVAELPDIYRLDDFELASRLSFFIWGEPPDDQLLDAAAAGQLSTAEGLAAITSKMMADPRAVSQTSRIHAMWLDYEVLPHEPTLSAAMRDESSTLVKRILMEENRPWHDLFREKGTYLNDQLASHYGLPKPGSTTPKYVAYGQSGRQGILSHGSFLAHGGDAEDRTPIHRGLAVRRGLLCTKISLPNIVPPELPLPAAGECRPQLLAAHASGGCRGCHDLMDPVGFGLETFDGLGRAQKHEPERPTCTTSGDGVLDSKPFKSVPGLSDLLVEDGRMADCFESQVYRFALGRSELDGEDRRALEAVSRSLGSREFTYGALISAIVASPSFSHRRQPPQ